MKNTDEISNYDVLVLNEGVNFREGQFNFFGGVQDNQKKALINFSKFKGKVYSINQLVDYNILTKKRKEFKELGLFFPIPEKVIQTKDYSDKLILGDSHSLSVYRDGYSISRNDGKTLHGFLKLGLHSFVDSNVKELVFYAGNIDVRFHLCRINPNIKSMVSMLERQILDLNLDKVSIVQLLPIENESRKIPKTGLYKGEPFYGTQNERSIKRNIINNELERMCERQGFKFLKWDLGDTLSFEDMEARQSVHLRPSSYMFSNKQQKLF